MLNFIDALIGPVSTLLDKVVADKDLKEKLAHDIVSGWRPAVGWTCCLGLAGNFIFIPMSNFIMALAGSDILIPLIDVSTMMPVLMGMLGLGAMRTVEKINKVERNK